MKDFTFSAELRELMSELTPKQRAAIPRLVRVGHGETYRSLLRGPDKICAVRTFYHRPRGWWHQPAFRAALAQAQKEFDALQLETAVEEAAERLRRAAPTAVELAEAVVLAALRGCEADGEQVTSLSRLQALMEDAKREGDQIRAASALMGRGLQAALSILDRADIETAVKGAGGAEERWADLLQELRGAGDDEVADVGAEAGDVPEAGVQAARWAGASAPE